MSTIVPPPTDAQDARPANHPAKPEKGDDEDFVEYLTRCADQWTQSPPPAPEGFELVECISEPRHWPEYAIVDDDFYPGLCARCQYDSLRRTADEWKCKATHRRWKSWGIWWRISGWLYTLGITSSGGGCSYGRCDFCGIGKQHTPPHWQGRRPYILGKRREWWGCLLRRRHIYRAHYPTGLCAICCPCPDCGSTDQDHYACEVA